MPTFHYSKVILLTLPKGQGWYIVGITHTGKQKVIAIVDPAAGEGLAQLWADQAAVNLAGKPSADID